MSKYQEKELNKNENKIHKRKRKRSVSSHSGMRNNDSDDFEWVEKVGNKTSLLHTEENVVQSKIQETPLERNEWMNTESFVPVSSCFSNLRKQKIDTREIKQSKELDKPGQSNRELNPHWKDGGNGLPQNDMEKLNCLQYMDVNWLKKSLRRAEEQALRDNRSLEEIAAERWGSLETIRSMISTAEKVSDVEAKSNYKRCYNDKNDQRLSRTYDSGIKHYLKSNSKSSSGSGSGTKTQENEKYGISNHQPQYKGQQRIQKPKDNDVLFNQAASHKLSSSNHMKNWKKSKDYERKCKTILPTTESEKINMEVNNLNNTNEEEKSKSILTEAEMNKLGARIIKAELMGDDELAAALKAQLEEARKIIANNSDAQKETVILTEIAAEDVMIPIQRESRSKRFSKDYKKKVLAETYDSIEKFQHEKANEHEAFDKIVSKSTDYMNDINDISDQQIVSGKAKQIKRDCTYAIKEHRDLSKYVDNCWWCLDSKNMLKHMIVTMDPMIYISLPAYTSLIANHCILASTQHLACQLQLDKDIWERLKEIKKKLTNMFINESLYPIFFEVYKKRQKYSHMQIQCIPLPKEIGELAPIYFKKALSECENEWSLNKKIIDLKHKNIRHAVPNGLSYFMIEFASHPGYAHIIENEEIFPKNFAEEIIGGMLDLDRNLWRKPKRQSFREQMLKVSEFTKLWEKYNSN